MGLLKLEAGLCENTLVKTRAKWSYSGQFSQPAPQRQKRKESMPPRPFYPQNLCLEEDRKHSGGLRSVPHGKANILALFPEPEPSAFSR